MGAHFCGWWMGILIMAMTYSLSNFENISQKTGQWDLFSLLNVKNVPVSLDRCRPPEMCHDHFCRYN